MFDTIFREYDIRGKVNGEFNIAKSYDLARSIALYFKQNLPTVKTVALGMDGRTHSPLIKDNIADGLRDSGLDVVFVGVCTSPVLYYALYTQPVDAGLMITASHNPKEYNGLKICLDKQSVWGLQVKEIRNLFKAGKKLESDARGTYREHLLIDDYVAWLAKNFAHLRGMDLSVVVDCGNGAGGTVMPQLVKAMDWSNVQLLYAEVDGTYPNHEADPVKEENMRDVKNILMTTDTQLGVGLDGDCDRMVPMTKSGFLVPGDQLLAVFAQQVLKDNPGAGVVMDIKSSSGLLEVLAQWGAQSHLSPSGHAIIKNEMLKHDAILGGELSCHFFFKDRYFGYDDGVYALLRLVEIIKQSGKTLDQLLTVFPQKVSSKEFRIACPEDKKFAIVKAVTKTFADRQGVKVITIDGVRASMPYGWGLVRASNTQPALSIRFESDTREGLQRVRDDFVAVLSDHLDTHLLNTEIVV